MAKTLTRVDLRSRLVGLARASLPWGRLIPGAPEWPSSHDAFRLLVWGPYRLIGVFAPRGARKFGMKTVLTEEYAREALARSHAGHKVVFR